MNPGSAEIRVTPKIVVEYFLTSSSGDVLHATAEAAGFDLRVHPDERATQFLAALTHADVRTLERFDEIVERHAVALTEYFRRIVTLVRNARKGPTQASYPFLGELILLLEYPDRFDDVYLTQSGWDSDIVELILRAAQSTREDA